VFKLNWLKLTHIRWKIRNNWQKQFC